MDDATLPFPDDPDGDPGADRARRRQRRDQRARRPPHGLPRPGRGGRQDAARVAFRPEDIGLVPTHIIGVVRDSRFRSIREPIDPIMFRIDRTDASHMLVRYDNADPRAVRAAVEQAWKRIAPDVPFAATSARTSSSSSTRPKQARAQVFAGFAILAVIVACLGLFGLAAFTAERRTKEIGIRKVLGARTRDIVRPARLAILQAGDHRQSDRLAGRLVGDAQLARTASTRASTLARLPFVLAGLLALADRHRHHRRPRLQGRARQPDPRAEIRIGGADRLIRRRQRRLRRKARPRGAECRQTGQAGLEDMMTATLILAAHRARRHRHDYSCRHPRLARLARL